MGTTTLVKPAPQTQVQPLQVWDNERVISPLHQPEIINPSRNITADDEFYLRDYTVAAAVVSWDMGIYDTAAQLVAQDITNIAITGDTVWYQLNHSKAIPLNIIIFHSYRSHIQQHERTWDAELTQTQNAPKPDSAKVIPQSATVATSDEPQPEATQKVEWKIIYDSLWEWYQVWVDNRCIGKESTYIKAERKAQQYIATDELIRRQNKAVLARYAG